MLAPGQQPAGRLPLPTPQISTAPAPRNPSPRHPVTPQWAIYLTNNASISLFWVTVCRNVLIVFFSTHISGCLFYYIARQTDGASWMKAANEWLPKGEDTGTFERYLWSLYFATVTFATVG